MTIQDQVRAVQIHEPQLTVGTEQSHAMPGGLQVGVVQEVDAQGQIQVQVQGQTVVAWISAWADARVVMGQQVLLALPQGQAALVLGVYPMANGLNNKQAIHYEADTDTLILKASRIRIEAEQSMQLGSADCQMNIDAQGQFQLFAQSILQSATGPYRLEGATVDIN